MSAVPKKNIELVPLGPGFGVEVRGLDPAGLDGEGEALFRRAFAEHKLVLFRGAGLSEDTQVRLTELLGTVSMASPNMKGGQKFSHISNVHKDGTLRDGELLFHSDFMFMEKPLKALALYALTVPSKGGETVFSDSAAALRALPADLRARITDLRARHVANYGAFNGAARPTFDPEAKKAFMYEHPVVWRHPDSGEELLFACPLLTESILGLEQTESESLLAELFKMHERADVQYEHRWRVGDYLVWDNRALQHARRDFDPAESRALRRVPIAG